MTVVPDGNALWRLREQRGMTIEQLAKRSGVSAKTIGRIETGRTRGCYARTMQELATALDVDWVQLLMPAPTLPGGEIPYQPADDERTPREKRVSPPRPRDLPLVPLRENTVEILRVTYRAEEGRGFETTAQVREVKPLSEPEWAAIGCERDGVGACFALSARTGHTMTRVLVYTSHAEHTLILRDAMDSGAWVDLILRVHVVKNLQEAPTVSEESGLPRDILKSWDGFTWPHPGRPEPWALRVTAAEAVPPGRGPRMLGRRKPKGRNGKK